MDFMNVVVKNPELVRVLHFDECGMNTIELFDGRTFQYELSYDEDFPGWFHYKFPNLEKFYEEKSDGVFIDVSKTPNLSFISSSYIDRDIEKYKEYYQNIREIVFVGGCDYYDKDKDSLNDYGEDIAKFLPNHHAKIVDENLVFSF